MHLVLLDIFHNFELKYSFKSSFQKLNFHLKLPEIRFNVKYKIKIHNHYLYIKSCVKFRLIYKHFKKIIYFETTSGFQYFIGNDASLEKLKMDQHF